MNRVLLLLSLLLFAFVSCKTNRSNLSQEVQKESSQEPLPTLYVISDSTKTNTLLGTKVLGKVKKGEVLSSGFSIKNGTSKNIVILNVTASCGCTDVEYLKTPIMSGDFRNFRLTYNSKDKQGQQFSEITVTTSIGVYSIELDLFVNE